MLAGQQPARDRVERDHADPVLRAKRQHLPFDLPEQQVIARLHRVETGKPQRLRPSDRPDELVSQEVRAADIADLARVD